MDWEFYFKELWYKILYLVGTIIYLISLNRLNEELLSLNGKDYFELAAYDNYAAVKYFFGALFLLFFGGVILYIEFKKLKEGYDSVKELVIIAVSILMVLLLLGLIIKFIAIPILKIIFFCVMAVVGVGVAVAS